MPVVHAWTCTTDTNFMSGYVCVFVREISAACMEKVLLSSLCLPLDMVHHLCGSASKRHCAWTWHKYKRLFSY